MLYVSVLFVAYHFLSYLLVKSHLIALGCAVILLSFTLFIPSSVFVIVFILLSLVLFKKLFYKSKRLATFSKNKSKRKYQTIKSNTTPDDSVNEVRKLLKCLKLEKNSRQEKQQVERNEYSDFSDEELSREERILNQKLTAFGYKSVLAERNRQERKRQKEEQLREINREKEKQRKKILHRDADTQEIPYRYQIGTHGNEALAIRYGIANFKVKGRYSDSEQEPSDSILLKKICCIEGNKYLVQLMDYGEREVVAVHEKGTPFIKTFLPLKNTWFDEQAQLENVLKNNGTFTLKELATFHVQKAVNPN